MGRRVSMKRTWRLSDVVALLEEFGGDECDVNSCDSPVEIIAVITDGERKIPLYLCIQHWRELENRVHEEDFSLWRFLAGGYDAEQD